MAAASWRPRQIQAFPDLRKLAAITDQDSIDQVLRRGIAQEIIHHFMGWRYKGLSTGKEKRDLVRAG